MVQESPDTRIAGLAYRVKELERLIRFGIVGGDLELVLTTMQQHSILLGKLINEVGSGNVLYGIEDPTLATDLSTHAALASVHHVKYLDTEAVIAVEGRGNAHNGSFLEPMTFVVASNGSTITGTIDKNPSGDLTERFSDGFSTLSSGGTVTLTVGGATAPKKNYIYVLQSNKGVLVASDSDWPTTEHIKVAEVVVQTAALVQSDGILANRNWNDHDQDIDGQGHHLHAGERLRWEHSAYKSGSAVTWSGSGTGALDLAITAGKAYQMHLQSISAFNTTDPDKVYVVNQPAPNAYTATADIETLTVDSDDDPLSNKYYNLVIWCSVSSGSEEEKVFINLPSGSYAKQGDAENDVSGYDNYSIPSGFRGYGYLVQRVTIKHSTGGGGTWTIIQETDLRGSVPTVAVGSGTASITTEFADSQFKLFDEGNPTREIAFQASGITAGNVRTITMPDEDVALIDDATSDPLIDGDAAADGTEGSLARKDHVHPKHHTKYLDSAAIAAVEGEATLVLTGDVSVASGKSLSLLTDGSTGGLKLGSSGDVILYRGAANKVYVGTGDSLRLVSGTLETDTIAEVTGGSGVVVDQALLKDNGIVFVEAADHPVAAAATQGQVWVKTATPNELWFTDDAGGDVQLGVTLSHDYDVHSGGVPSAELEYDDATSDPLIDADSAADGTESSAARKDHVHPKHHAKYTNAEAITAVQGEATLDLTGDVTIDGAKSLLVDVINEKDAAAGVTIEGVLLKDDNVELEDNTKLFLGTGKDASIYYDTTDLILDPDVVGTGVVRVKSADGEVRLGDITAGTASTDAGIMLSGGGSYESAIFTEVGGEIFSYGINVPQMSSRNTARVGAYFYLDIRTSVEQYGLRRYAKSGSTLVETFIIDLENGGLTLRSPDDSVAPCLAMRQENSGVYGWDWDIDTLTTGELYLKGVINSTRVVEQMWDRVNHRVGIGTNVNPAAKLDITQSDASGAIPVLELDQDDIDDTFINLVGTSAADSSRSISSSTASAAAKFGAFRVEINGVTKWVRVYDSAV